MNYVLLQQTWGGDEEVKSIDSSGDKARSWVQWGGGAADLDSGTPEERPGASQRKVGLRATKPKAARFMKKASPAPLGHGGSRAPVHLPQRSINRFRRLDGLQGHTLFASRGCWKGARRSIPGMIWRVDQSPPVAPSMLRRTLRNEAGRTPPARPAWRSPCVCSPGMVGWCAV